MCGAAKKKKNFALIIEVMGFPGSSDSEVSAYNAGDLSLIPGSGRSPGDSHVNPFQYFLLENPMDREAWRATVHGFVKNRITTERLILSV